MASRMKKRIKSLGLSKSWILLAIDFLLLLLLLIVCHLPKVCIVPETIIAVLLITVLLLGPITILPLDRELKSEMKIEKLLHR